MAWLGLPTPLQMYRQHCRLLENEIQELNLQLRKARADVFGISQMLLETQAKNREFAGYLRERGAAAAAMRKQISDLITSNYVNKREAESCDRSSMKWGLDQPRLSKIKPREGLAMCGRLSQYRGIHDFVAALSMPNALINSVGDQPIERYNVAPTTKVALLHIQGDLLHADPVRWGWRPHWAKDRATPINARVEKVAHGPFFRAIWPHPAITPIDSWFEWVDEGGPKKQPYLIRRRDGAPVLCAAIGQLPDADEGPGEHDGFVIITADSAGGMVDIHDRRPVVLKPDLAREWLNPATPKERAEQIVLFGAEQSESFQWFKVDTSVGNARNEGCLLIKPSL